MTGRRKTNAEGAKKRFCALRKNGARQKTAYPAGEENGGRRQNHPPFLISRAGASEGKRKLGTLRISGRRIARRNADERLFKAEGVQLQKLL